MYTFVLSHPPRRDRRIFAMWLACHTQEEIAEACGVTHPTAIKVTDDFVNSVLENQTYKAAASHATDFDPPFYNIWMQQEKTPGSKHFGNSEVRWVADWHGWTDIGR
jgi:hypothetical protein